MAGSQSEIHSRCPRIGGFPTLLLRKAQEVEASAFNPGAKRSLKGTGGGSDVTSLPDPPQVQGVRMPVLDRLFPHRVP